MPAAGPGGLGHRDRFIDRRDRRFGDRSQGAEATAALEPLTTPHRSAVDATDVWLRFARSAPPLADASLSSLRPPNASGEEWSALVDTLVRPLAELVRTLSMRIVGITGPPGSGKSSIARLLVAALGAPGVNPLALSLDDFYLSRRERAERGIAWRGGPGTHDLALLVDVLGRVQSVRGPITIPRFSAHADDRASPETFPAVPDLVVLEGWFLGYPEEGYGEILDYLDLLVFLDVDIATARERRFGREDALREAGGGFSARDMRRFWDEVLEPGIAKLVPLAKQSSDVIAQVGGDQRVRSMAVRDDAVLDALMRAL